MKDDPYPVKYKLGAKFGHFRTVHWFFYLTVIFFIGATVITALIMVFVALFLQLLGYALLFHL